MQLLLEGLVHQGWQMQLSAHLQERIQCLVSPELHRNKCEGSRGQCFAGKRKWGRSRQHYDLSSNVADGRTEAAIDQPSSRPRIIIAEVLESERGIEGKSAAKCGSHSAKLGSNCWLVRCKWGSKSNQKVEWSNDTTSKCNHGCTTRSSSSWRANYEYDPYNLPVNSRDA